MFKQADAKSMILGGRHKWQAYWDVLKIGKSFCMKSIADSLKSCYNLLYDRLEKNTGGHF